MSLNVMLALKFLKSGRNQTILIILGIAVGISILVFIGALIDGLQKDLIDGTVGNTPHIIIDPSQEKPTPQIQANDGTIYNRKTINTYRRTPTISGWKQDISLIEKNKGIITISPAVIGAGFISKGGINKSVVIRGLNINEGDKIYDITRRVIKGEGLSGSNNILIGSSLANDLDISINDIVNITTNNGNQDLYNIQGIFDLENEALNNSWIVMDIGRAQKFFNLDGNISTIELQVEDIFMATSIANNLKGQFKGYDIKSWQENNQQLLTALNSQSSSTLLIQVFVLIAVTLGIASVLAISVIQKSKQIGILKAMGIKTKNASSIFLLQGFILGFLGSLIGSGFGSFLTLIFVTFVKNEKNEPLFPIEISFNYILTVIIIATIATTLAAAFPARRSAKLDPIEVIRNG
ncbi:ABC transporter permease [Alkaliphilus pronyensis]|uniref:ABC transporter permease n=1 Tax=Alkaliphilus pronyensis TaxID=1482732 RepID=A0A6I0FIG1_9FIRM|nr:FtsX-like permease family protein [Alkaliphilus pronyensis]KAB3539016.1 ABC transporter permease [Alkaliphilus pronyensis]